MRQYPDAQEEVARRPAVRAGEALAREPDALAVAHPGGNLHVEIASIGQREAATAARGRLLEPQLEDGLLVGTTRGEPGVAVASGAVTKDLGEDVAELAVSEAAVRGPIGGGMPRAAAGGVPAAGRLVTLEGSAPERAAHATWASQREIAWQALFPNALSRLVVTTEENRLDALVRFFHARMRAGSHR